MATRTKKRRIRDLHSFNFCNLKLPSGELAIGDSRHIPHDCTGIGLSAGDLHIVFRKIEHTTTRVDAILEPGGILGGKIAEIEALDMVTMCDYWAALHFCERNEIADLSEIYRPGDKEPTIPPNYKSTDFEMTLVKAAGSGPYPVHEVLKGPLRVGIAVVLVSLEEYEALIGTSAPKRNH
jgi:hypothetical protein